MKSALILFVTLAGCYRTQYPITPAIAEASTYEMYGDDYTGTAWAVADHTVMTAGHMCASFKGPYILQSSTGRKILGTPIAWELAYDDGRDADLCVIRTEGPVAPPLILADHMPSLGEAVGYVGYPLGVFTHSSGKYTGDNGSDAPCDHGASGSAMYSAEGVWGVLVHLRVDGGYVHPGSEGCIAIPLPDLKAFLDFAEVDYAGPPALQPNPPQWEPGYHPLG